jgi:hypothetical protein
MRGKNHRPPDPASRPPMCNRNDLLAEIRRPGQCLIRQCHKTLADHGAEQDMKKTLALMMLLALAPNAHSKSIDWQAELDRCRALREQMEPLLLAGQGISPIARSGASVRRCVWIERRALKRGAR